MTDQDAVLKLARAVYPDVDWMGYLECGKDYACDVHTGELVFDPATNDTQAVAALLWLMRNGLSNVSACGITWATRYSGTGCEQFTDQPSFRSAVTKAALRVVQG